MPKNKLFVGYIRGKKTYFDLSQDGAEKEWETLKREDYVGLSLCFRHVVYPNFPFSPEFFGTGTLENYLAKTYFETIYWINEFHIAKRLAKAVNYLHQNGLSPTHLSPKNIFIDHDMRPKLYMSIEEDDSDKLEPIEWASPEEILQQTKSNASDVYRLGLIFGALGNKRSPSFRLDGKPIRQAMIDKTPPKIAPYTPKFFKKIITAAIHFDPSKRPTAASLVSLLNKKESSAQSSSPTVLLERQIHGFCGTRPSA